MVTVVNTATPKAAKVLRFSLKPLSLHKRIHATNDEMLVRPRTVVTFRGNVGVSVLRDWIQTLFFDIPPKAEEDEVESSYTFKNVFTGALTVVFLRVNELRFESESASTVTIAKECIEQMATSKRVQIQESISNDGTNDEAVISYLHLVILYRLCFVELIFA